MDKLHNESTDLLFDCVLKLKNKEECYRFFEDVCTVKELQAMSQRVKVAKLLKDGHGYAEIAEATGASTATISRVGRSVNYGSDGYTLVFERKSK